MERIERAIDKEITKLQYYLEPADELIENNDITETEAAVKQASKENDEIMDLISHLELTKSQIAEKFQRKLNAFITRRTRLKLIISDNAAVLETTASWIKKIRKSEKLQDYLAKQDIRWKFNLAKSP